MVLENKTQTIIAEILHALVLCWLITNVDCNTAMTYFEIHWQLWSIKISIIIAPFTRALCYLGGFNCRYGSWKNNYKNLFFLLIWPLTNNDCSLYTYRLKKSPTQVFLSSVYLVYHKMFIFILSFYLPWLWL